MQRILLYILSLAFLSAARPALLTIENQDMRSELIFSHHRFGGATFVDAHNGVRYDSDHKQPLFEIAINGRILSSEDPIWNYKGCKSTTLTNQGTVVTYSFRGRGIYKALRLEWDREYFPSSPFIRERLRLRSADTTFHFTNVNGHNHFVFPRYALKSQGTALAVEHRIGSFRTGRNLRDHHMYHPDSLFYDLSDGPVHTKGPFLVINSGKTTIWTAYEHASQDKAFVTKKSNKSAGITNDGQQGTEGDMGVLTDDDLWFISTDASLQDSTLILGNHIRRGGYIDGELIPTDTWYETVWSVISFEDNVNEAIGEYLYTRITENKESRNPDFYYNTWGMQRDYPHDSLYTVMNGQRLLEEIDRAAEAGVQTFVIDDGWHVTFGDWRYNRERLPNTLQPLVDRMRLYGITPGIWLSLVGAGKQTPRTQNHPEWIIKDRAGQPIAAQWGNPVYDLVGPFYDAILQDLKDLVDQGFRFFKWDGVNLFNSDLPGLAHGDSSVPAKERIDRYNYLFPFYVTSLMRQMREYCPGVVVEIDLTEAERCLIGLMVLQEGKYYFINNGASKYKDYGPRRTRSVRSTVNEYGSFFPQELFTYAVYPRDDEGSLEYNITTAIQAGHGIWGDMETTTPGQRRFIAGMFSKARMIFPHVAGHLVEVKGTVHSTPEVYVQRNPRSGFALFTAFGDSLYTGTETIGLEPSKVLGVLGSPYSLEDDGVHIPLGFSGERPEAVSAFVLGSETPPARVLSSTGKLDSILQEGRSIVITAATESVVMVQVPGADGFTLREILISPGDTASVDLQ